LERTVVGIDVGTSKVCTLIGEIDDEGDAPRVVGVGIASSKGVRRGVIVDVEEVARAISASVERAERVSGYPVARAYVGIAAEHISSFGSRGAVAIPRGDRGIAQGDADRAMEAARAIAIPHNREVLHVVPRGYTLDGQDGVRDPIGMLAFKLEVEVHIVTGSVPPIQNLVKAVEQARVDVEDLVFGPLACSEAVLSDVEREMGVVLADVGAGTTDIAIFMDGAICHALVLPTGGDHITNDIAIGLQMPFTAAEEAKISYGHVLLEQTGEDEMIDVQVF
jgi:cell division protein FtsA